MTNTNETYSFYYNLGATAPNGATSYPGATAGITRVQDDSDSSVFDGSTAVGDLIGFDGDNDGLFTDGGTLWGLTSFGEPIIEFSDAILTGGETHYWVLSKSNTLSGLIGPQNSGTFAYCFARGTLISTPEYETKVEELKTGDLVLTAEGKSVPVKWVGRQTLHKLRFDLHMQPVRIRAGALGNGLPHTDLTVTADHGMILEGYVVNASVLVNGDTIDFVPMAELEVTFTVYHIETENHDVILANGAPAETFVDAVTRSHFDNYQEYLDLYGAERLIPEMPQPRITSARMLPEHLKVRLGLGPDNQTEQSEVA